MTEFNFILFHLIFRTSLKDHSTKMLHKYANSGFISFCAPKTRIDVQKVKIN